MTRPILTLAASTVSLGLVVSESERRVSCGNQPMRPQRGQNIIYFCHFI